MPSKDVMPKFHRGKLHSGSKTGKVVKDLKQAKAIAASEARAEKKSGGRYPEKGKSEKGGSKRAMSSARDKRLEGKSL